MSAWVWRDVRSVFFFVPVWEQSKHRAPPYVTPFSPYCLPEPVPGSGRQSRVPLQVPMANISLYYYAGTAYLMLRRYIDAGRCFNSILSFIDRVKKGYQCVPSSSSLPPPAVATGSSGLPIPSCTRGHHPPPHRLLSWQPSARVITHGSFRLTHTRCHGSS